MSNQFTRLTKRAPRRARALATLLLCAGCGGVTDVDAPDLVQPDNLANPAGMESWRAGAINAFVVAFSDGSRGQVIMSGAVSDEFHSPVPTTAFVGVADQRTLPDPGGTSLYAFTQRARGDLERAIPVVQRFMPNPSSRVAELYALLGYAEIFLGEAMCSGVPLGRAVDGRPEYGAPLTTAEIFERATAHFDSALALAADSTRVLNLARVGRARALLGIERFADAATSVAAVPTAYVYATDASAAVQPNGVFDVINNRRQLTVGDREGANGLDFRSAADPRVPTSFVGTTPGGTGDIHGFSRYVSLAAPITLASGVEARLIEAEATLRAGDAAGALTILNALRATMPGLAPLGDAGSEAARVDQLFRERAFWLFATGHRQGDLRRLVRQYGRSPDSVFPSGPYFGGQLYGSDVNFAPDAAQLQSPLYTGCASREA